VTDSIVVSVLDTIALERPSKLPETLCIDEFKGSSGEWNPEKSRWDVNKYHCNISDGDAGVIIDILPRIRAEYVSAYFRQFTITQRKRVRYYCCDMHGGFVSVARELFPEARICIDLFHVIKLINDTVDAIRRRLQHELEGQDDNHEQDDKPKYLLLKGSARSLLTSEAKQERLGNPNNARRLERLTAVFACFPELAEAYDALQEFHFINSSINNIISGNSSLISQKASLTDWILRYSKSQTPELVCLARSIRHWRGYIQNTWQYNRSNGPCEGLNNKIKVLKRISFGLHCFDTFRKRVLLTCGYFRPSNEPFTVFHEKRNGGGVKL
jgi:transposase